MYRVLLAGHPNVGKSTLFNALTGGRQHTGNWQGKTVGCCVGRVKGCDTELCDLPGCYTLSAASPEEGVARREILFSEASLTVVVCDATALGRTLGLFLQIAETGKKCALCVTMMDEARRRGIAVDLDKMERLTGVPVIGVAGGKIPKRLWQLLKEPMGQWGAPRLFYGIEREARLQVLETRLTGFSLSARTLALLISEGAHMRAFLQEQLGALPEADPMPALSGLRARAAVKIAEACSAGALCERPGLWERLVVGKYTAIPLMLLFLAGIFWLTAKGANLPSQLLQGGFTRLEQWLYTISLAAGVPTIICNILWQGIFRVTAWVVAVMLPPMVIFFPLFTLLEDVGLLPRFAFNVDRGFEGCGACGRQCLCMMMGLGCNAVGVTGCRIIPTRRERLLAILTNAFMPCNGRLPLILLLLTVFLAGSDLLAGVWMAGLLALSFGVTLGVSKLLSLTLLKGKDGSFIMELPPYRTPRIGEILRRSLYERAVQILGRALRVAAPAGLIIWLIANITVGGQSLMGHLSAFLAPFAQLFGMDGVILTAFILALPAAEIALPLMLMGYTGGGTLTELTGVGEILAANGWDGKRALCVLLFCVFHFPCATTLQTVAKETGSRGWAVLAALIPTAVGLLLCLFTNWVL